MKVLHIISGGDTGGAKTSVITLLEQLNKLMTVQLVCFMEGEFSDYARERGVDVLVLTQKNRWDLSVVQELSQLIAKEDFDLINCHGARANFVGAFLKRLIKIPMLTTVHSDYSHDFDNSLYKKLIFTTLNRISLRRMDGYITMAEKFKSDMVKRGFRSRKIFVAYNGIPLELKESTLTLEAFAQKYQLPYHPIHKYVGTASRLHPIKGVDVLLRAALSVKKVRKDIKFVIAGVGDDKYTQSYLTYVKDNGLEDTVYFLGYVADMSAFYQLLQINTITSHSEAVCYALLEGGRLSKPSIASRVGGTPELIENGKTGLLFEDDDHEQLAELIIKLIEDAPYGEQLGGNLHDLVYSKFSDVAMAARYNEIYQENVGRSINEKKV